MYFIVGCGRSGTNWLAQIIDQHPDVFATIEHPDIFPIVTECALDPTDKREKLKPVFDLYRKHASDNKIYLDKSHPNLWHIDLIREEFPEAKFIGIQRDVYGVVSSMMQHGCAYWGNRWKEFPLPNKFLGVTEETAEEYDKLSLMQKCVWRWCNHNKEMFSKWMYIENNLMVIQYQTLVFEHKPTVSNISRHLGVDLPLGIPDEDASFRWRGTLDLNELDYAQYLYRRQDA
jgi:hypothetical protein